MHPTLKTMHRLSIYEIKILLCLLRPEDGQDVKWKNFNFGPLNFRENIKIGRN